MSEDINDFGFTFQSEEDFKPIDRTSEMFEMMKTFLENLKGDKDSNIINWPGDKRHKQIDAFINKLEKTMEK
jgi:hypothetical protein